MYSIYLNGHKDVFENTDNYMRSDALSFMIGIEAPIIRILAGKCLRFVFVNEIKVTQNNTTPLFQLSGPLYSLLKVAAIRINYR